MPSYSFRSFLLASLFFLGFAITLPGQSPTWPIAGPGFAASPADIQNAAARIPAEPSMEATVLYERDTYSFDASGRLTYRHTMIYRIETKEGVDDWAEIRVRWSPWYQNPPEIRARVIAPDGKVTTLDPKTITDGPAREGSEDTYSDDRLHKVPLPAISVGAIVEEEAVCSDKQPFFSGGGTYIDSFTRYVPIVRAEVHVDVPASANFRFNLNALPQAAVKNEVSGDIRHFSVEQGYLPARTESDISLPTHNYTGPFVQFSTGDSWATVAAAYSSLAEANIDPAKVKNLLPKPGANRMETIARIVAELHKDVRYTGIEFGQASLQPAPAAEVLNRHYGDCKDKAALLVSMLRAAGIDAHMALLDSGPGNDLNPDLPGMNLFDHAIVFVPPAPGADALWIDATAEYNAVGSLPQMDEGREALIIAQGTEGLTLTPTPKPDDDQLTELRDFALADNGPAKIVETSMTRGDIDASYRSIYGGQMTRETREDLEKYAKSVYLAKALANVTHGDAHNLSQPFALKLEMADAARGNTVIDNAVVWIPFGSIFARLPGWFRTDPRTEGEKLTPQQEENRKRAVAARTSEYDLHPFATEWRYTITPPDGFQVRALPENKTTPMGPAVFTQHYETGPEGQVVATLRFETAKPRYTTDETLALRDAVLASYKQDALSIWFDQTGSKLIAAGKMRDALATDRSLIAKHPSEGIRHAHLAYAFLKAGLGDRARSEAEEATRLDPKSSASFNTLGWVCEFNEIGVRFGYGFDWDCAANGYKKALALDPDDPGTAADLAILEEYDSAGERYTAGAHLDDAIATLRTLKEKDKSAGDRYEDYLLYDFYFSGHYQELLDELDKVQSSAMRRALEIAGTVALGGGAKGISAGVERMDRLEGNGEERAAALASAGNLLLQKRLYPEAAGILSAAVESQQDSAGTAQQIALLRNLAPWNGEYLPASDPRSVVQRLILTLCSGVLAENTETIADEILTHHAFASDDEWRRNQKGFKEERGLGRLNAQSYNWTKAVLLDVMAGNLKLKSEGTDDTGYRVTAEGFNWSPTQYFVSREEGGYRLVGNSRQPSQAGNYALYLLKNGREKEARALLDWIREREHKGGGDDPLSGPLFPRFWTVGDAPDPDAMRWAAASLAVNTSAIRNLLPDVRAAWEKAPAGDTRLNLALLLAYGYRTAEDGAHLKEVAAEILKSFPDSYTAIGLAASADQLLKDWDDWKQMLESRLAEHPDDEELLRMKARCAEARGDWAGARATLQMLFDSGKATSADYNMYGWSALFDNSVNDDAIKASRQSNTLTHNNNFSEMHTLACLYAAAGKTSEARDLLLKAMPLFDLSLPNSPVWCALGLVYEQYGVDDAAIAAYEKVEKPEGQIDPEDTWLLAQARLKALKAKHP